MEPMYKPPHYFKTLMGGEKQLSGIRKFSLGSRQLKFLCVKLGNFLFHFSFIHLIRPPKIEGNKKQKKS